MYSLLLLTAIITAVLSADPCIPRDYGHGSVVCVCNSTYCDTIDIALDDLFHPWDLFQYTTTKSGKRLELTRHKLNGRIPRDKQNLPRYKVHRFTEFQEIIGFGAALTDGAGYNVLSLSQDTQDALLRSYFGPEGIDYTLLRVAVGSNDASLRNYTYDDDCDDDVNLDCFNLTMEEYAYKIPIIKRANELSGAPVKLFGSSWLPPMWMIEYDQDGQYWKLKREYWSVWVDYFVKFFDAYKKEDLYFWGLTEQNEPYSSMEMHSTFSIGWTLEDIFEWTVTDLGPTLREKYSDTKIIILDDMRSQLQSYADLFYQNETASSYVSGAGIHWPGDFTSSPDVLDSVHDMYSSKFILYTEAPMNPDIRPGPNVILGDWTAAQLYTSDMIDVFNHNAAGWVDWSYAANTEGGPSWSGNLDDSSIIVNASADEFYKQPSFYAHAHLSKFVPPGSVRVLLTVTGNNDRKLESVAFRNPSGKICMVIHNKYEEDTKIIIDRGPHKEEYVATIKGNSINTLVYH